MDFQENSAEEENLDLSTFKTPETSETSELRELPELPKLPELPEPNTEVAGGVLQVLYKTNYSDR